MTTNAENCFWNDEDTVAYFGSKPADPRIVDFLDRHVPDGTTLRALDLGCGGGRHSELLASRGFALDAVDVNPAMLAGTTQRLQARALAGTVTVGSILAIPYADSTFDIVVSTGVLHQARNGAEYDTAIGELGRVLKVGGYALLNIFTDAVWDDTYTRVEEHPVAVMTQEHLPMTLLSKEDFNHRMQARGMVRIEDHGEDIKQENTGPRAVYRAHYQKIAQPQSDETPQGN